MHRQLFMSSNVASLEARMRTTWTLLRAGTELVRRTLRTVETSLMNTSKMALTMVLIFRFLKLNQQPPRSVSGCAPASNASGTGDRIGSFDFEDLDLNTPLCLLHWNMTLRPTVSSRYTIPVKSWLALQLYLLRQKRNAAQSVQQQHGVKFLEENVADGRQLNDAVLVLAQVELGGAAAELVGFWGTKVWKLQIHAPSQVAAEHEIGHDVVLAAEALPQTAVERILVRRDGARIELHRVHHVAPAIQRPHVKGKLVHGPRPARDGSHAGRHGSMLRVAHHTRRPSRGSNLFRVLFNHPDQLWIVHKRIGSKQFLESAHDLEVVLAEGHGVKVAINRITHVFVYKIFHDSTPLYIGSEVWRISMRNGLWV